MRKKMNLPPALAAALAIAALYILLFAFGITCPIKFAFGISCPGCGMTRALWSAIRLDFGAAFEYHPLWCALPPFAAAAVLSHVYAKPRLLRVIIGIGVALLLIVYVIRLSLPGEIVGFAPNDGIIIKIIQKIFNL